MTDLFFLPLVVQATRAMFASTLKDMYLKEKYVLEIKY
jgi:hypothetical protein